MFQETFITELTANRLSTSLKHTLQVSVRTKPQSNFTFISGIDSGVGADSGFAASTGSMTSSSIGFRSTSFGASASGVVLGASSGEEVISSEVVSGVVDGTGAAGTCRKRKKTVV